MNTTLHKIYEKFVKNYKLLRQMIWQCITQLASNTETSNGRNCLIKIIIYKMHLTGDRLTIWSGDNLIKQLSDLQRKVSWSLQVQTTNSTLIQYNKYMYTVHNTYMFNNIYYIHSEPEKKTSSHFIFDYKSCVSWMDRFLKNIFLNIWK